MTFSELSTIIRYRLNPVVILVNNFGYQIEEVLHAGDYNLISNWSYHSLVKGLVSSTDKESWIGVISRLCTSERELAEGLRDADTLAKDRLVFLECRIEPSDVSEQLLKFGKKMGKWSHRKGADAAFAV